MPGLIKRDDIDEVRSRTNIADVVGDHVTLKGAGVGSLKGLCPFHDERSPSFHVRPQVGRYHCFGCGEDGDVYSFVMKTDHTTFQEAVERLASRIGFTLRYEDGGKASDHGGRARLIAANEAAREFFAQHLTAADADPARRFLGERGFDPAAAERFGVGFAPKSFDALRSHLKGAGFADEELVTAGLLSQGDRSPYDRFRGRLVWPIRDVTGSTIGFGARRLLDDDKGPKYLNTPETPIYHKSQVLYGLDLARRDIAKGKQVVIVEGYTDVMACHLAGVTTAVATCGTSFGVDHIKLLRPMLGESAGHDLSALGQVVFTFDPDEAGQKAASRAFAEEQRFQTQTFVALPPEGLDPCDLRLARGDDAVRRMIDTRRPMFEFMIQRSVVGFDLETVEGRASAVRAAAPAVASIRDNSIRLGYARFLAKAVGEDTESVVEVVTSVMRQAQAVAAAPRALPANASEGRQSITSLPPLPEEPAGPSLMTLPGDLTTRTERDAVMAMLQHPDAVGFELMRRAVQARLETTSLAVVRDAIGASLDKFGDASWLDVVLDQTPAPFDALAKELAVAPIPERQDREITTYCRGIVVSIVERDLIREKSELMGRSFRTDVKTDPDKWREIQVQLAALEVERRALTAEQ
ncbi:MULTISPECIES: DNA primase [unclassified Frigoribacterium]|uniref:DNA primase n=1 Tax=unclassified Frigoribacterium TaxID=2627005 RepID=UPI000F460A93|nr:MULTISPECIES: DNA primase [unclassified Frigoribacterium]MBF4578457.1 DNA primase [Frigoribacterium sp. VKM Ac-2530]ROP77881.1 DNA primase [Frigoribacterium sp. PhB107]TDT65724.1 DNA primase [Frigoribacterium sp. PhB116]